MTLFLLILGLVLFIGLVVLHEFGHFIVARRNGVEVEEFGIGFPPRLWGKEMKSGYVFSINALPLGGFVKLKGEHDADTTPGSFGAASLKSKSKIMLAGVGLNLLAALVILMVVAVIGMPKVITKDTLGEEQYTVKSDTKVVRNDVFIAYVEDDSPADKTGLEVGDQLISLNEVQVKDSAQLPNVTKSHPGEAVKVVYKRKGQIKEATATLRDKATVEASQKTSNPVGYLGISPTDYSVQRSTWSAPVVAVGLSVQITKLTFQGLWTALQGLGSLLAGLFTGNQAAKQAGQEAATSQVSGPLGIFFILQEGARRGFGFILFIIGILSLTLAIMNVLPIPALDGGRFYLMLISRKVFGRPLSQKVEERVVGSSFVALILLFVLITIVDYNRFL